MPFDKNIFTKKCTFLYNRCQLHVSTSPTVLVKTRNAANKLSVHHFSIILDLIKFFFQSIDIWNKHDRDYLQGKTKSERCARNVFKWFR